MNTPIPQPNSVYRARPLRVIDGDTIICLIDNGFRNREEHSIRLIGVFTPEINKGTEVERDKGLFARSEVQEWIWQAESRSPLVAWPLIIQTEMDKQTFNRYIGRIWSLASGDCLNDWLIGKGYGPK